MNMSVYYLRMGGSLIPIVVYRDGDGEEEPSPSSAFPWGHLPAEAATLLQSIYKFICYKCYGNLDDTKAPELGD